MITQPAYTRSHPYLAAIAESRPLNSAGSAKDTRHIVVDIEGSGMIYHAGDSLGVCPRNPKDLVAEVLAAYSLDPAALVAGDGGVPVSLEKALTTIYTLNRASKKFIKALAEKAAPGSARDRIHQIASDEKELEDYIFTRDLVDIRTEFPETVWTPDEFVASLTKILPRLYSIASSPAQHPQQVHLTVAVLSYETHGRKKEGLASGYLASLDPSGEKTLPIFVQSTRHFHLPQDLSKNIIMVGPGTGIAPFRAFLQERKATGATGKNWLFFGDQRAATDFLYRDELEQYLAHGSLASLDTAFSRDQEHKIYVQHLMLQRGAELWRWLQKGAYFYVCGDAKRMARDVNQALIEIAVQHGGLAPEAAADYINTTLAKTEKRYLKDVY